MALRHLELSEMVGLTAPWVEAQRPQFESIPHVAAWLPQLDSVHRRLMRAQPNDTSALAREIAAINAKQQVIDERHDNLVRFVSLTLEAEQCFCRGSEPPRQERADLCEQAAKALFPKGLLIVNALYIAEGGNARRTRELIATEGWLRTLLTSLPTTGGGTLLSVVESYCSHAIELGELDQQKSTLLNRLEAIPQPPRAEMLAARNAWLALVNTILTVLDMVEGHAETVEALRAPILRTAEIAGRRHAKQGGDEAGPDAAPGEPAGPAEPLAPATPAAPVAPVAPGFPGAKPFA